MEKEEKLICTWSVVRKNVFQAVFCKFLSCPMEMSQRHGDDIVQLENQIRSGSGCLGLCCQSL